MGLTVSLESVGLTLTFSDTWSNKGKIPGLLISARVGDPLHGMWSVSAVPDPGTQYSPSEHSRCSINVLVHE